MAIPRGRSCCASHCGADDRHVMRDQGGGRRRPEPNYGRSVNAPAPVRIGLVGYGVGGRYFHAPLIASAGNCEFLGVVTTSGERRRQVLEDLDRPAFSSLGELAAAGAEAVTISTPMATHVTLTEQALRLGLAVCCDKPFAPDADSASRTVRLAEQLGVPLTVYQNRRWDSDFLTLRELLDKELLGTLTRFESRFERFRPESGPSAAGGGTLLDFGSHLVDQALQLSGAATGVYAEMHYRDDAAGLDDDVFVALSHGNGVRSHLWGSWRQGAPGPRLRATGTSGTYVIAAADGQEVQLRSGMSPASAGQRWGVEPPERWGHLQRGAAAEPVPSARGAWDVFYQAFAAAVRGTQPMPVDPWDAVATAAVLDAARISARTAQVMSPAGVSRLCFPPAESSLDRSWNTRAGQTCRQERPATAVSGMSGALLRGRRGRGSRSGRWRWRHGR